MKRLTSRLLNRALSSIEWLGNRLPDPIVLYALLAAAVPFMSALAVGIGWAREHPVTGDMVRAINLLDKEQMQRMWTEAVDNFTSFAPLGAVLVTVMGIGVAERSGLIDHVLRLTVQKAPRSLVTVIIVFAGIMSSMAADSGYVVLTPLGAVVFAGLGRHPLAGLAAAFAGVAGGFSANLLITSLDPLLSGFTDEAARLYLTDYAVTPDANYFFMIASTVLITLLGWAITEWIVEPRLGKWNPANALTEEKEETSTTQPQQIRALTASLVAVFACITGLLFMTLPENALLRDEEENLVPFVGSLVPIIAISFLLPGTVYGIVSRSITSTKGLADMLADSMATMGGYVVLAFAAAQFIAWFGWSNLGLLTALEGAAFLQKLDLGSLPVLLTFVWMAAAINLVIGSASAKWGIMATVFVPMFMILGITPETTQAAYRVGDSITNMITPLNPYFPIILSFALKYDPKLKMGTLVATMLPYSIAFAIGWCILFSVWYGLGLPLGPGAPIHLIP